MEKNASGTFAVLREERAAVVFLEVEVGLGQVVCVRFVDVINVVCRHLVAIARVQFSAPIKV